MRKYMNRFVVACVAGALLMAEASPTMALPLTSNGAAVKEAAPESLATEVRWHRHHRWHRHFGWHRHYGWRRFGWRRFGWGYPYYAPYYGYYRYRHGCYGYPYGYYGYPYGCYGYPYGYYGWR